MADGQVLIDSKINTAGVTKGTKDIKEDLQDLAKVTSKVGDQMEKELDGAGKSAEKASGSFKELFKANLSATAVIDVLKKVGETAIEIGKQAVEAAAEINASNAQFEQTFNGIEGTARETLNNISKEVDITATRMQNSYTKIFAFTKSVGADQEQALSISERALRAAADSAAYYDVSMEEATETLQSFLKGNYENDAALGIAATETTRNAKANELYAKSFKDLSEAQKVDVLLAMVEAGNEASGALGQAAREADSWTNVIAELQEAWRLMLAALGDPVLEGLIPIIQGITGALQALTDKAASANLSAGMEDFRESISGIDKEFNATSEAIEKNAAMADLYKQRLAELEREGFQKNSASAREYANAVDALNAIYPELNLQISEVTGELTAESRAQLANIDAMKKKAVLAAQEQKLTAALEAQADAIIAVQAAEKELLTLSQERAMLQNQLGMSDDELAYAMEHRMAVASELTYAEAKLLDQIIPLYEEEKRLAQGIEEGNAAIAEQDTQLESLRGECESAAEELGTVAEAEQEMAAAADTAAESQEELAKRFQEAKESARDSLESTVGLFGELKIESKATAEEVIANWQTQQEAFTNYAQNLQTAIDMGLDEALVQQLADGSTRSMEYLQMLVTDTSVSVEEINAAFQNLSGAKDAAATAIAGIQESIDVELQGVGESVDAALTQVGEGAAAAMGEAAAQITVNFTTPVQEEISNLGGVIEETFSNAADTLQESWGDKGQWFESSVASPIKTSTESIGSTMLSTISNMESETAAAWNRMVQDVQNAINRMQSSINSLTGKSVNISVNKTGSGASMINATGYDGLAYTPDAVSAVPAGIPMLATGAVIPPNAPFFAVLGDQTSGRNLEAPEKLIRQIIQEEMGEIVVRNEINFVGELAALARILYPEIQSEAKRIGPSLAEEVRT